MVKSPLMSKGDFTMRKVKTGQKQNLFHQKAVVQRNGTAAFSCSTEIDKKSHSVALEYVQFKQIQIIWNEAQTVRWSVPHFLFDIFLQYPTTQLCCLSCRISASGIPRCRSPPLLKSGSIKFQKRRIIYGFSIRPGKIAV